MSDTNAEVEKMTSLEATPVICSICLDAVAADLDRSTAKLQCGHEFHLDCIGSAFNVKKVMQCPNCRKVETGRWLYASSVARPVPEIVMENWNLSGENHGVAYPGVPFSIRWCPFSDLEGSYSSFEVVESSQPAYHNLPGPASSEPQSYVAYIRPNSPASSVTVGTIENPYYNYQLNGVVNPDLFPVTNMQYPNGVHNSQLLHANSAHMQPSLIGHGSQSRGRLQPSQTIQLPQTNHLGVPAAIVPGGALFNGRSTLPRPPVPTNSVSNRSGAFFMFPPQGSSVQGSHQMENSFPSGAGAGSDLNRTGNFWDRPWTGNF